jgi:hypothetical protein
LLDGLRGEVGQPADVQKRRIRALSHTGQEVGWSRLAIGNSSHSWLRNVRGWPV